MDLEFFTFILYLLIIIIIFIVSNIYTFLLITNPEKVFQEKSINAIITTVAVCIDAYLVYNLYNK